MNREKLLANLHETGLNEGADFNDALLGWFGWRVDGGILTVHFDDDDTAQRSEASWRLVPIQEAAREETLEDEFNEMLGHDELTEMEG